MDTSRQKGEFSFGRYLLKGLIVLTLIGGGYYFYFGKMGSAIQGAKAEQVKPEIPPEFGWVNGILYSKDDPSLVLDKDIVSQGQIVHGVKVLKIHKDKVEFEKDGNRWEQKLKEEPNRLWITQPETDNK